MIDRGNAPPMGGIGAYAEGLLDVSEHSQESGIRIREAGISLQGTSARRYNRARYLLRLFQLRGRRFDNSQVIHFLNYYVPRRVPGIAYVATVHDLDPLILPEAHPGLYVHYFNTVIKKTVTRSHLLITQTEAVRNELLARFPFDVDDIFIGGDAVSPQFIQRVDVTPSTIPKVPVLLFVGQINKKKNIAWTFEALRDGVKSGEIPALKLVLAGSRGFGFNEVQEQIRSAGTFVKWYESPSLEVLVSLYRSCSAVIVPSLREGFGRPLLEAMCCEKPIIASRIPSSLEVAGEVAHFFPLGDKAGLYDSVRQALSDGLSLERTSAARRCLQSYSWHNLSIRYLNIYREAYARISPTTKSLMDDDKL